MKKPTLREMFTIPNILSYFRILLIPLFVYLYFKAETPPSFFGRLWYWRYPASQTCSMVKSRGVSTRLRSWAFCWTLWRTS